MVGEVLRPADVQQRIAHVDDGQRRAPDDDAAPRRGYFDRHVLVWIGHVADDLAHIDAVADALRRAEYAALRRAQPARGIDQDRCTAVGPGSLGGLSQLEHAHLRHHAGDTVDAGANGELVEPQPLAAFVAQHVDTRFARGLAQRAGALGALQHDIGAERAAELLHPRPFAEHAADLRQIDAMDGGGMQVDADLRSLDDLAEEQMRQPRSQRAVRRPRKRAIEIASIGQVARTADEAENVDHGDAQERAPDALRIERAQQTADDLNAVDLIAVDCRRYEHRRTGLGAVQYVHRQRDRCMIGQLGDGQVHQPTLARLDGQSSDDERLPHGDAPLWRCAGLAGGKVHEVPRACKSWCIRACTVPAMRSCGPNVSTPNCATICERRAPLAPPPRQRAPVRIKNSWTLRKSAASRPQCQLAACTPAEPPLRLTTSVRLPECSLSRRASDLGR